MLKHLQYVWDVEWGKLSFHICDSMIQNHIFAVARLAEKKYDI